MGELVNANTSGDIEVVRAENDLIELTEDMLLDVKNTINNKNTLSVPIAELSTLGAGVSSIIPALNTITQTTTINTSGLYRWVNSEAGEVLKMAKNGDLWGAGKTVAGKSKMARFQEAGPLSATTQSVALSPATMMIAVALYSIEKELKNISEAVNQILSFLEIENESEIEADVETLLNMITKYKHNWDNKHYVTSNHKLVLDIQRTARKNMNVYQKKVSETLKSKQFLIAQNKINTTLTDLQKNFKYYRLSIYTFSLASLMEIMLSNNFNEEYISGIKDEIKKISQNYRELFSECSVHLEKMENSSIEANTMKILGTAGKSVGKFISNIPIVSKGNVDEFLQDKGSHLQNNSNEIKKKTIKTFATVSNPDTGVFIEKLEDMIKIYNHTSQIYFDKEKIYLLTN